MTITAISADGVVHQFPDDTDGAAIDDAMKRYAQSTSSAGFDPSQPSHPSQVASPAASSGAAAGRGTLRLTLPDGRTGTVSVDNSFAALQGISGRSMPTANVTGLPTGGTPVNTPIRGAGFTMTDAPAAGGAGTSQQFRPNTPADVASALSQDDGSKPATSAGPIDPIAAARLGASISRLQEASRKPVEGPAVASAPTIPADPQATPTDSRSLPAAHPSAPLWEQLVASGDPTITRRQVRDSADKVYPDDMIAALDATSSFSSDDQAQTVLQPIRDRLQLDGIGIRNVQPETPPADSASAAQGAFTPGSRYIANVVPGMDHARAVEAARAAEAAGRVPAGTADMIATSPAPLDPRLGRAIQDHALEQIGIPPTGSRGADRQWAVDRSQQARVNAAEYQNNARALAQANPALASTILAIAQSARTPEAKTAIARAFYAQHPEHIGRLPKWLLNHGYRGAA